MKLVTVIKTLSELAFDSAEYVDLFNRAMAVFREDEQEVLQLAYDQARLASNAANDEADKLLKAAAKK